MNKVLVNVYVPILNTSYDVFIPVQSQAFEVLELIKKAVTELSGGIFIPSSETCLIWRKTGEILDANRTISDLNIRNAEKLMLV